MRRRRHPRRERGAAAASRTHDRSDAAAVRGESVPPLPSHSSEPSPPAPHPMPPSSSTSSASLPPALTSRYAQGSVVSANGTVGKVVFLGRLPSLSGAWLGLACYRPHRGDKRLPYFDFNTVGQRSGEGTAEQGRGAGTERVSSSSSSHAAPDVDSAVLARAQREGNQLVAGLSAPELTVFIRVSEGEHTGTTAGAAGKEEAATGLPFLPPLALHTPRSLAAADTTASSSLPSPLRLPPTSTFLATPRRTPVPPIQPLPSVCSPPSSARGSWSLPLPSARRTVSVTLESKEQEQQALSPRPPPPSLKGAAAAEVRSRRPSVTASVVQRDPPHPPSATTPSPALLASSPSQRQMAHSKHDSLAVPNDDSLATLARQLHLTGPFALADALALSCPPSSPHARSVSSLAAFLTRSSATPDDTMRARAIFRWVCAHVSWSGDPGVDARVTQQEEATLKAQSQLEDSELARQGQGQGQGQHGDGGGGARGTHHRTRTAFTSGLLGPKSKADGGHGPSQRNASQRVGMGGGGATDPKVAPSFRHFPLSPISSTAPSVATTPQLFPSTFSASFCPPLSLSAATSPTKATISSSASARALLLGFGPNRSASTGEAAAAAAEGEGDLDPSAGVDEGFGRTFRDTAASSAFGTPATAPPAPASVASASLLDSLFSSLGGNHAPAANSLGFALLFASLARTAGLECKVVRGVVKRGPEARPVERVRVRRAAAVGEAGSEESANSPEYLWRTCHTGPDASPLGLVHAAWNLLFLPSRGWVLLDCFFGAGTWSAARGQFERRFSAAYWVPEAEAASWTHFPMALVQEEAEGRGERRAKATAETADADRDRSSPPSLHLLPAPLPFRSFLSLPPVSRLCVASHFRPHNSRKRRVHFHVPPPPPMGEGGLGDACYSMEFDVPLWMECGVDLVRLEEGERRGGGTEVSHRVLPFDSSEKHVHPSSTPLSSRSLRDSLPPATAAAATDAVAGGSGNDELGAQKRAPRHGHGHGRTESMMQFPTRSTGAEAVKERESQRFAALFANALSDAPRQHITAGTDPRPNRTVDDTDPFALHRCWSVCKDQSRRIDIRPVVGTSSSSSLAKGPPHPPVLHLTRTTVHLVFPRAGTYRVILYSKPERIASVSPHRRGSTQPDGGGGGSDEGGDLEAGTEGEELGRWDALIEYVITVERGVAEMRAPALPLAASSASMPKRISSPTAAEGIALMQFGVAPASAASSAPLTFAPSFIPVSLGFLQPYAPTFSSSRSSAVRSVASHIVCLSPVLGVWPLATPLCFHYSCPLLVAEMIVESEGRWSPMNEGSVGWIRNPYESSQQQLLDACSRESGRGAGGNGSAGGSSGGSMGSGLVAPHADPLSSAVRFGSATAHHLALSSGHSRRTSGAPAADGSSARRHLFTLDWAMLRVSEVRVYFRLEQEKEYHLLHSFEAEGRNVLMLQRADPLAAAMSPLPVTPQDSAASWSPASPSPGGTPMYPASSLPPLPDLCPPMPPLSSRFFHSPSAGAAFACQLHVDVFSASVATARGAATVDFRVLRDVLVRARVVQGWVRTPPPTTTSGLTEGAASKDAGEQPQRLAEGTLAASSHDASHSGVSVQVVDVPDAPPPVQPTGRRHARHPSYPAMVLPLSETATRNPLHKRMRACVTFPAIDATSHVAANQRWTLLLYVASPPDVVPSTPAAAGGSACVAPPRVYRFAFSWQLGSADESGKGAPPHAPV